MTKKLFLLGLAVLFAHHISAQITGHSVQFWFGGKTGLYGLSYETIISENYIVGTGLGSFRMQSGDATRYLHYDTPQETTETGSYRDISFMAPVYAGYSIGNLHRFNSYLGITMSITLSFNDYPSGKERFAETVFVPYIGLGYERRGEKYRFNSNLYMAYLGKNSGWFPPVIPWVGIGFGPVFGGE